MKRMYKCGIALLLTVLQIFGMSACSPKEAPEISLSARKMELSVDGEDKLKIRNYEDLKGVSYDIEDDDIVEVEEKDDGKYVIHALKAGTAKIIFSAKGCDDVTFRVTVTDAVAAAGAVATEGAVVEAPANPGPSQQAAAAESTEAYSAPAQERSYVLEDLYITVDGTVTANVDNRQDAFIEQWEAAVSEKLGHPIRLHINQPDHSRYSDNVSRLLTTGSVGDGSYPDAMIMSATMFRQYEYTGILWNMADAYDNAEFQNRITLPSVNENLKTRSGELYGFSPTYGNGCVTYIKQSWLDRAGKRIEDIKTYDDYYNLLKTFANGRSYGVVAAGFGKLDEAPYINYMPEFWQDAYPAFYQKNGRWVDGFQEDATARALDRLAQAYADGIIDPDTEGASTKIAREKFFSNDQTTSGAAFTYWAGTWFRTLTNNMEKQEVDNYLGDDRLVLLPPIKEIRDSWGGYLNREAPVWVITDDGDGNDDREQAIFDALLETMLDGDTVQTLWTYGAKGVHWDTRAESFTTNAGTDKARDYNYEAGQFHLRPYPNDPNSIWKKNHLDAVLVIAPLTNGYVDNDPLVIKGNKFFTENCVNAPVAAACDTLTEYNSDMTMDKITLMNLVVTGGGSFEGTYVRTGADAVAAYKAKWGRTADTILAELN